MELRTFGRSGMQLSVLGFGCGAVGGLMVRGESAEQERAIARALEAGVNYFDTAVAYGDGASETNLGRVLGKLKPANAFVATKVRLPSADFGRIAEAVRASLDASLKQLDRDYVDIFHLHNPITETGGGETLSAAQVLGEVAPAFEKLHIAGKTRFIGLTAVGDTAALHRVIDSKLFDSAQVSYNMLNPSAAIALPQSYPAQDFGRLFDHTKAARVGVIGIRAIAGGALSGSMARHANAGAPPPPIGSAMRYEDDVARAQKFAPLIAEGYVSSLPEAALRFVIANPNIGVMLVGLATPQEFEAALAALEKGPLPQAALDHIVQIQQGFAGETR